MREGRYGWVHSGVQLPLLLQPGSRICRSSFPPRCVVHPSSSISSVSPRSSSFRARGALRGTFSPRCILLQDLAAPKRPALRSPSSGPHSGNVPRPGVITSLARIISRPARNIQNIFVNIAGDHMVREHPSILREYQREKKETRGVGRKAKSTR